VIRQLPSAEGRVNALRLDWTVCTTRTTCFVNPSNERGEISKSSSNSCATPSAVVSAPPRRIQAQRIKFRAAPRIDIASSVEIP